MLCEFTSENGTQTCKFCGRKIKSTGSVRAQCRSDAPRSEGLLVEARDIPTVLCQLELIPDTADCRCTQCGAIYANAKPEEIKARCALEGLGQPPNVRRLFNFGKAVGKHWLNVTQKWMAGDVSAAYRTPEEIDHIFTTHCQPCPFFKNGICGHSNCGCNLGTHEKFLNKLKWRSEHCPDNPPRWT